MRKLLIEAALSATLSSTANAAITIYTSQSAFQTAVASSAMDTFDDFNTSGPTASPIRRSAGSFGYTASSQNNFYGAGSGSDHWLSTNRATDAITFTTFTGGVSGFGGLFFDTLTSGNAATGDITITATDASGTVSRTLAAATTSSFLGYVSTGSLLSATVTAIQPADPAMTFFPTVNNLTLANTITAAVPELSTWAMMFLGMGAVGFAIRRRQKVSTTVKFA